MGGRLQLFTKASHNCAEAYPKGAEIILCSDSFCGPLRAKTLAHTRAFQVIKMDGDTLTYNAYAIEGEQTDHFKLVKHTDGTSTYSDG